MKVDVAHGGLLQLPERGNCVELQYLTPVVPLAHNRPVTAKLRQSMLGDANMWNRYQCDLQQLSSWLNCSV
jgi:hypothetical protein